MQEVHVSRNVKLSLVPRALRLSVPKRSKIAVISAQDNLEPFPKYITKDII